MDWCAEINMDEFASVRSWSGVDPTAKAFEPGHRVVEMTPPGNNKDKVGASIEVKGRC
jgi:hypothetical protein